MANYNSSNYWKNATNYQAFELRSHRFRDDMLPVFYKWLGIDEASNVLDCGCGSGVFTRFLSKGLTTGRITGFDISEAFINFGKEKILSLGLDKKVTLEIADGYHLHYSDNCFDVVTNYTYTGVLSDMKAGIQELVRVCKKGGMVSSVIALNSIPNVGYEGNYPFDGAERLQQLAEKERDIWSGVISKKQGISQLSEIALFKECGLTETHVYPFAHLICYSDSNLPIEYRKALAIEETASEINWLKSRYTENEKIYHSNSFSIEDFNVLVALLERKLNYLSNHFETDESYEWFGGFNFIVTGKK